MSAYLSPVGNEQQSDSNGAPVSGALIYTYAAGTTTLITTYTDSAGLVSQTNPIVCNSSGYPASPLFLPAGQAVKLVFTTSVASGSVAYRPPIDNVTGINDPALVTTQDQWVVVSATPTYVNGIQFRLDGDQTNIFTKGRRVRTVNTSGTVYSTVLLCSYSAGTGRTTVSVLGDVTTLDSGLSQVSYGLLSTVSPSFTGIRASTYQSAAGTSFDFTGIPAWARRITIAYSALSTNGVSPILLQLGDSGGIETNGYLGGITQTVAAGATTGLNSTAGIPLSNTVAAGSSLHGLCTLVLLTETNSAPNNTWVASVASGYSDTTAAAYGGATKPTSAALDRVRITTVGGADTFDAGIVNVFWE